MILEGFCWLAALAFGLCSIIVLVEAFSPDPACPSGRRLVHTPHGGPICADADMMKQLGYRIPIPQDNQDPHL